MDKNIWKKIKAVILFITFWATLNTSAYVPTGNPTASGLYPKEGITCAANYIHGIYVPFGTQIELPDGKILYVEDRFHPDYGYDALDIFMESYEEAIKFGRRSLYCKITIPEK